MVNELKKAVWVGALVLGLAGSAASPVGAQDHDAPRKVTRRVTPLYSELAKKSRLLGTVKLSVTVAPDGTVKAVKTLGGNAVLAALAEAAAKQWKFEPLKNETVEPIVFSFNGE
jgi:TonB family protein